MLIPYPERVSLTGTVIFSLLLSMMLFLSGTGPLICFLLAIFNILAAMAFNAAGGLTRPSGSYVFFFTIEAVLLGFVVKAIIWEPSEITLLTPNTTMMMYTGGMASMLLSVYVSRKLARGTGFLQDICSTSDMRLAAIGCVVAGFFIPLLADVVIKSNNAALLPIAVASHQFDRFLPMGIILGVTYEVKSSGGKRSTNFWAWIAAFLIIFQGFVLEYGKEALFTPLLCWSISAAALRFRVSVRQIGFLVLFVVVSLTYLVPYSQYGRNFRDDTATFDQKLNTSIGLLQHLEEGREVYRTATVEERSGNWYFFKNPMGLFDRLTMVGVDDALVSVTDEKGTFGLYPIALYFESVVPRVFWKNKPMIIVGNLFAHEIGFNDEDTTTGIAFSPMVEAYHEAKWYGVFLILPFSWILLFTVTDSLCGDVRKSPWGLLVVALFGHIAPEGMLQGAYYVMFYGSLIVCIVAFSSAYVLPVLARFVTLPQKREFASIAAAAKRGTPFGSAQPASSPR